MWGKERWTSCQWEDRMLIELFVVAVCHDEQAVMR